MSKTFYITTTLPYVNADPHIGFAFELVSADIIARYKKLTGFEVFFNTGTDEHGTKILEKAKEEGKDPKIYADEYAEKFQNLQEPLGLLSEINFIRTTDAAHIASAQEFWKRCKDADDIYKKNYRTKYCAGCELEKTDSELVDGKCSIHPQLELQVIEEENYFFRLSKYQQKLLDLYEVNPDFVVPAYRLNEIRSLIKEKGLEDFSISRLKSKMPWGVPVPDDSEHVMYVWFDALVNYISAIGWPAEMERFKKWWPVVQYAGKDQVRQQAVMWQAMLMSAKLPPSKQIVIHGFITSGGEKMSKSLGNVVNPLMLASEYGTEALRWYLSRHINPFEDSDFTLEKFKEAYNADLANGIGNLASRILQMSSQYLSSPVELPHLDFDSETLSGTGKVILRHLDNFEINRAMFALWSWIQDLDGLIQEQRPFEVVKTNRIAAQKQLTYLVRNLAEITVLLEPFMPETSHKIQVAIQANKKPDSLFPRK